MSEPKWTPGPWALHRPNGARLHVIGPDSYAIALIYNQGANNARLIAAAPELAQAALLACLMFERKNHSNAEADWMGDDEHEAWTALRNALAKARGEA